MKHPQGCIRRLASLAVLLSVSLSATLAAPLAGAATPASACPATLNHTLLRLQDEKPQSLCQYAGKVVLAVNTASYCGFTPQYKGLEALQEKYKAAGLVVLGFPSNDFAQEKGSNKEIAEFCENTFGVKFPMVAASGVRGDKANPFFRKLIDSYSSMTAPDSRSLVSAIEKSLKAQP